MKKMLEVLTMESRDQYLRPVCAAEHPDEAPGGLAGAGKSASGIRLRHLRRPDQ
ncbi:MAG: hypothetical protein ACO1N5_10525 [Noviherbaspirillum sp.]